MDEHPGEGWDDGRPNNWRQLRMFIAGLMFALGLFTSVFLMIRLMQVVGITYRASAGEDVDLGLLTGLRAGLASLRLQDVAALGIIFGPMLIAGRAMMSVFVVFLVLDFAFCRSFMTALDELQNSALGTSDPNNWASVVLLGLLLLFSLFSTVVMCLPQFRKASSA